MFKTQGKLTNRYIADHVCLRYSARIAELRAEGHTIVANRIKEGLFEYTYVPNEEADLAEALGIIISEEYQEKKRDKSLMNRIKEWL